MTVSELRDELGLSLECFAKKVGLRSRGRMSVIEQENRCSLSVALRIESLSGGRVDAASLNEDVRASRAAFTSLPARQTAILEADRVVFCDICERRADDPVIAGCAEPDCPRIGKAAA